MNDVRLWGVLGGAVLLLGVLFITLVPLPFGPPADTRIILDHTLQVYVAPPCFNDADLTNYLTETTWQRAQERGYQPESLCSAQQLEPVARTAWTRVLELAGVLQSPWAW